MALTLEKESRAPSVCSTRASTVSDSASESGLEPNEGDRCPLKKAITHHFASLASTQSEHHGVPVGWSAGQWIHHTWADADMEAGITKLFADLGLESKMTIMKHAGLSTFPRGRTNGFWLPVWKFRLDRDAKNGSLALSHMRNTSQRWPVLLLRCALLNLPPLSLPPDVQREDGLQGNHGNRLRSPQGGPRRHPGA
jgi:hypothetical protein